jgi:hypothetical protein
VTASGDLKKTRGKVMKRRNRVAFIEIQVRNPTFQQ